jgi:predicted DNA-binding ribbon-helix-helix protein
LDRAIEDRDPARPVKRSVTVAGHRTSVSLERAFWDGLQAIAAAHGRSLNQIVTEIDRRRGAAGLSSSLRVFVLNHYRGGDLSD